MLIHYSGWYFGKELTPEVRVAVECQTKSDYFYTNVIQLSSKIFDEDFTPAIETVGCQSKPIKFYSVIEKVNFISATLLFQDSDHHLGNEAYVSNGNQYSYIRLDVELAVWGMVVIH